MGLMTVSNSTCGSPQISLPVWTKRHVLEHTSGYKGYVPQETKIGLEGQIHSEWEGSLRSSHIREDARIWPAKGVPVWFYCEAIIL